MLLIVNFDGQLADDTARLQSLIGQLAAYLEEALDQTLVRHVRLRLASPTPPPPSQAAPLERKEVSLEVATTPGRPGRVRPASFALTKGRPSLSFAAPAPAQTAWFSQTVRPAFHRPTTITTPPTNLNRLAEVLLGQAGLWSDQYVTTGPQPPWQWDDGGPVVIIPPAGHTAPALSLFLGHALAHYLHEVAEAGPLYVVTRQDPFELQEWD